MALVVVAAAGVEAEVPAERAHAPVVRAAHRARGLDERARRRRERRVARDGVERGHRAHADDARFALHLHAAQRRDARDRHEPARREQALLHVRQQIGAASDDRRVVAVLLEQGHDLGERRRRESLERGQRQHGYARLRRASRTREGENGSASSRTPTASWMALATAGMLEWSGPSPASLAPSGPSGS